MLTISKELSTCIRYVNCLAILMVVGIHSKTVNSISSNIDLNLIIQSFLCNGVYRVSVPVFFLISGILFFKDVTNGKINYGKKIHSRVSTLLIPYLFYSMTMFLLFGCAYSLMGWLGFMNSTIESSPFQSVYSKGMGELFNLVILTPIPAQLWFLRDLIALSIVSPVILFLLKNVKVFTPILLLIWSLGYQILPNLGVRPLISIDGILFFSLGGLIAIYPSLLSALIPDRKVGLGYFIVWIATNLLRVAIDPRFDIWDHNSYSIPGIILYKISTFFGLVGIFFISKFFHSHFLSLISNFSFSIYLLHLPLCFFIVKLLGFTGVKSFPLALFFIAHIVTIFFSTIISIQVQKKLPFLYKPLSGGR